jgi:hypothetical protein
MRKKEGFKMRFTMKYDEAIIQELRAYAQKNNVTLTSAINTAIAYYLGSRKESNHESKNNKRKTT